MVTDILYEDNIALDIDIDNKEDALNFLTNLLFSNGAITDRDIFIRDVYERESQGNTFIGDYIAIPHGKSDAVVKPTVAMARLQKNIKWNDKDLVKTIILFAVNNDVKSAEEYLRVLSQVAGKLGDSDIIKKLDTVKTKGELLKILM